MVMKHKEIDHTGVIALVGVIAAAATFAHAAATDRPQQRHSEALLSGQRVVRQQPPQRGGAVQVGARARHAPGAQDEAQRHAEREEPISPVGAREGEAGRPPRHAAEATVVVVGAGESIVRVRPVHVAGVCVLAAVPRPGGSHPCDCSRSVAVIPQPVAAAVAARPQAPWAVCSRCQDQIAESVSGTSGGVKREV